MNEKPQKNTDLDFQIINWIGIIEQLASTKVRQLLEDTNVPPPQFSLLNHFSHRPDEGKTVTSVANAMQQPQPGITKTLAKMLSKGFLKEISNPTDKRSKILFLTPKGIVAHQQARQKLIEGMGDTFNEWDQADKKQLFNLLDRLKIYLDDNR